MQNISGRYEIQILRHETGELETVHEQDNLITDYGLNFFGIGSKTITTKTDWELNRCAVWLKDFPDPTTSLTENFYLIKVLQVLKISIILNMGILNMIITTLTTMTVKFVMQKLLEVTGSVKVILSEMFMEFI